MYFLGNALAKNPLQRERHQDHTLACLDLFFRRSSHSLYDRMAPVEDRNFQLHFAW